MYTWEDCKIYGTSRAEADLKVKMWARAGMM